MTEMTLSESFMERENRRITEHRKKMAPHIEYLFRQWLDLQGMAHTGMKLTVEWDRPVAELPVPLSTGDEVRVP